MFTQTIHGYALDPSGRKHYSIHPRVSGKGKKVNTCKPERKRAEGVVTTNKLAKVLARRNARRNANGTHNSGSRYHDHMAGSMKCK